MNVINEDETRKKWIDTKIIKSGVAEQVQYRWV